MTTVSVYLLPPLLDGVDVLLLGLPGLLAEPRPRAAGESGQVERVDVPLGREVPHVEREVGNPRSHPVNQDKGYLWEDVVDSWQTLNRRKKIG